MAKISNKEIYGLDTTLSPDDYWVGTDAQNKKKTKTYTAGGLLNYILLNYSGTEQNNFVTEKALGTLDSLVADVLIDTINGLDTYTVDANEIIIFTGAYLEDSFTTKFNYILQAGKGYYGLGGTQLAESDLLLLNPPQEETRNNSLAIRNLLKEDKILSGNVVWTGQGLVFQATPFVFVMRGFTLITGLSYPQVPLLYTLSDADLTNPRIDLFVIDSRLPGLMVIEGTPAPTPQEPTLDFGYQLRVTAVLVPVDADPYIIINPGDTPTLIDITQIYDENTGEPMEWTPVFNPTSQESLTVSQKGASSIRILASDYDNDSNVQLTTATPVTFIEGDKLVFQLYAHDDVKWWIGSSLGLSTTLSIIITDGVTNSSLTLNADMLRPYGYIDKSQWCLIVIPISDFINAPDTINAITFSHIDTQGDFFIDDIKIQSATSNPTSSNIPTRTSQLLNDGHDGINPFKMKIQGYWVDKNGNNDYTALEVGDEFEGWVDANRYVVGRVIALPFDINDLTKVKIVADFI